MSLSPAAAATQPQRQRQRQRQPLSELPLHLFVSQAPSPSTSSRTHSNSPTPSKSRPSSRSRSRSHSVSPHKQAVIQNHQRARAQSVTDESDSGQDPPPEMAAVQLTPLNRKLFHRSPASPDVPLENSPILPLAARTAHRSPLSASKTKINTKTHTPSDPTSTPTAKRTSVPATPTDAQTTPHNGRTHRPSPVTGPKPSKFLEPSPSTTRHLDHAPLSASKLPQASNASDERPSTPSRHASEQTALLSVDDAPDHEITDDSPHKAMLKSLPRKKYRVSKHEIALAHEIVGSGPIGSPSPCKIAPTTETGSSWGDAREQVVTACPLPSELGGSPRRRRSDAPPTSVDGLDADLSRLQGSSLTTAEAASLFQYAPLAPASPWTVYEDPTGDSGTEPTQDHSTPATPSRSVLSRASTPNSPLSTPNKENRNPSAAQPKVSRALDVRSHSASPAEPASRRKRGTGGRLSLLAKADADDEDDKAASPGPEEEHVQETSPPKKTKLLDEPVPRSPESVRGRSSRKVSSTTSPSRMRRQAAAAAAAAAPTSEQGSVASRTRSKTRA